MSSENRARGSRRGSRFDRLLRWRFAGEETAEELADSLSVENLTYEETPERLAEDVTAFRHLRQDARISACRTFLKKTSEMSLYKCKSCNGDVVHRKVEGHFQESFKHVEKPCVCQNTMKTSRATIDILTADQVYAVPAVPKDPQPKKMDLLGWLNPEGNNFMGSGMNMQEWLLADGIRKYHQSWGNQEKPERRRRMHFVTEMILEMRRVQETYGQCLEGKWYVAAGAFMENAIEAVITGDKRDLEIAIDMYKPDFFAWNYGGDEGKVWAERYTRFYELCVEVMETWPSMDHAVDN